MSTNAQPNQDNELKPEPAPSFEGGAPNVGADLRLKQQVADALGKVPGGEKLDEYFGISGGTPQQPTDEAARSDELIGDLQALSAGSGNLSELLGKISSHNADSGVDPDLLRALMCGPKKQSNDKA